MDDTKSFIFMDNTKLIIFVSVIAAGLVGRRLIIEFDKSCKKRELMERIRIENEFKIKKLEIEATYPPEYWEAKAAEAEATYKTEKARIELDERLELDSRDREDAEIKARREFEQNAPAEYWAQKKFAEEQKTIREAERRRYDAEVESAKLHRKAIEESAKAAERALANTLHTYSNAIS